MVKFSLLSADFADSFVVGLEAADSPGRHGQSIMVALILLLCYAEFQFLWSLKI